MKSTTQIRLAHDSAQQEAQRIAKRLLNHWKHKFAVEQTDDDLRIDMPDARVVLRPLSTGLAVEIDTTRTDYQVLETVVIDHLNRMAQQQFQVQWQHQSN